MATSKVNTSRFLAKGGDRGQKAGSVQVSPVSKGTVPSSGFLSKGGNVVNSTVGGRISGLASNAKVRDA